MAMLIANVTFGPLGRLTENDEGAADILVGANLGVAQSVGYITRVVHWGKSGSSRKNVPALYGYKVEAWDAEESPELAGLAGIEFGSLKMCKDAVRDALGVR